jgi:two-component system nitrate/nitrite sensor histidine kinase NarX
MAVTDNRTPASPAGTPWLTAARQRWLRAPMDIQWVRLLWPLLTLLAILVVGAGITLYAVRHHTDALWFYAAQSLLTVVGAALVVLALWRIRRNLVEPLSQLRIWAQRVRTGNFAARVPEPQAGDFVELARDINRLSDWLTSMSLAMDTQVRNQAMRLARKTQSLDVLYDVANSLSQPGNLEQLLDSFLDTFIELVDARAATVRLVTGNGQSRLVASRGLDPAVIELDRLMDLSRCQCGWVAGMGGIQIQEGTQRCTQLLGRSMLERDCAEFVVVPVQYQDRILGVYNLFLDRPLSAMGEDVRDLLMSIGRHLGLALEKARLDNDARRLAIMEERNMIGNELHDSLAQSLVSMRLQIKMLGESLYRKDLRAAQNEVRTLRMAIEEAHTSLRELLANFRLKIDDRGLVPAITNMIERFRQDTGVAVFFQNECANPCLTPRQEIQVYYIVQEALANVRKHAHAKTVRILLTSPVAHYYSVLIEDDGYGMTVPTDDALPGEHMGLTIMRERAERLPGELTIESDPGEGTRVMLTFSTAPAAPAVRAATG